MAINPELITTIRVDQLADGVLGLDSLIPHTVGNELKRSTIQELVDLVATSIGSGSGVGFLPISVTDGQQLPNVPENPSFFLSGAGTYLNINGFPNIICTQELNAIMSLNDHWDLAVEIPINATDASLWIKSNITLANAQRNGDVLYGIIDRYTGEEMTLSKVTGSPTVDGIMYFALGAERFLRNYTEVNPKWFGAKGDGATNDSPAFQNALNFLNGTIGGTLKIPAGIYRLNTGLTTYPKVKIVGSGQQNTFLYSYLTGENYMLTIDGASVSTNTLASWSDFSAVSPINNGGAFLLLNAGFAHYENIYSEGFTTHWRGRNILSSNFTSVKARFGVVGFFADSTGGSNPNAITFNSCVFGSMTGLGLRLDDPSNFNMLGGSIEACGSAPSSAVVINNGGSQGAAAWNFQGVYFEGNLGIADIQVVINNAQIPSAGMVHGCSFNRISGTTFTVNNILLQQIGSNQKFVTIDVKGNAFINSEAYIPSITRKYIDVQSASKFKIVEESNYYMSELEIPQKFTSGVVFSSSMNIDCSVLPLNAKLDIIPTDEADFTFNAPINAKVGQELTFIITNITGDSLGLCNWNVGASGFRLNGDWVQPTNNKIHTITFIYTNYGLWVEKSRSLSVSPTFITVTETLTFPSISSNDFADVTVTVTGASVNDSVSLGAPANLNAGLVFCGRVTDTNVVRITLHHTTGATISPDDGVWRITLIKF